MHQQHEVSVPIIRTDDLDQRPCLLPQTAGVAVVVFERNAGRDDGGGRLSTGGVGLRFHCALPTPDQEQPGRKYGGGPESEGRDRDAAEDRGHGQLWTEPAQHDVLLSERRCFVQAFPSRTRVSLRRSVPVGRPDTTRFGDRAIQCLACVGAVTKLFPSLADSLLFAPLAVRRKGSCAA